MIFLFLFGAVYLWMSITWYLYTDALERPPVWRTAIQTTLLTVFATQTNYPALLLAFGLISLAFHLNIDIWEPAHSGIATGMIAGLLVVVQGIATGHAAMEWIQTDGQLATALAAGVGMSLGTAVTQWKGHPIRSVIIMSGLRLPEHKIEPKGDYSYGEAATSGSGSDGETPSNNANVDASAVEADPEVNPFKEPSEGSDSESNSGGGSSQHSVKPAGEDSDNDIDPQESEQRDGDGQPQQRTDTDTDAVKTNSEPEMEQSTESSEEEAMEEHVVDTDEHARNSTQDGDDGVTEFRYPWEEPPDLRFEDIGGYHDVKDELVSQVVKPLLSDKESYERFDVEPSQGLLFHGPPGTGKTLFARALANALNRPFVELTQADITHHHVNKSPKLIQQLFEEAQQVGGVVFIDEAEQLLGERDQDGNVHAEDLKITNMFLSALTQEDQDFILLLTTNQRDAMDEAILRPGRVDNEFEIGLPDYEARLEILKLKVLEIPHRLSEDHVEHLAEKTDGWSGADLDSLTSRAKLHAAERNADQLEWADIKAAYQELVAETDSE